MAKTKKGKKPNADAVYSKKGSGTAKANPFTPAAANKKMNPFEVHVNKEKFQILGRTCKHDKGLPGVSRGKAIKKRKETLGKEYMQQHKTNKFRDRRIGKHLKDYELTEEVLNARFLAEKMSQLRQGRASKFSLNDDETLTHRGKTLAEIEQFNDVRSDDEGGDDEQLDANFTEVAHFGGEDDETQTRDRKTAIDEMILEQKRRKIESAKEKEEVQGLTDILDSKYKELVSLMGKMTKHEIKKKDAPDDYDKLMREMIFEPRGVVTDKLLSEEELARQEKERLERLERERLERMRAEGEDDKEENAKPKHRSADDLDDGYFDYADEEEESTLAYHLDGELGTKINGHNVKGVEDDNEAEQEDESSEESEEENEDKSGSDTESDAENETKNESLTVKEKGGNINGIRKIGDDEEDEDDNESKDEEDDLSDLKSSASESEIDDPVEQVKPPKSIPMKADQHLQRTDLPFTLDLPTRYEEFKTLLMSNTSEDQAIIVERLIKCNHPKLDGVNSEKVVKLFVFLLQHIDELFCDATQDNISQTFDILGRLNPQLYDVMHLNPEKMSQILLQVVKEKYAAFKKNTKVFPPLETIILFKLVSNFCSTSDFRHPVVTPCYIFMQHILSKAVVRSRQDIAMGLFLVTVVLEYSELSHRFLPAAFNFLLGVVYLCIPKRAVETLKIVSPFKSTGPLNKLLAITSSSELENTEEQLLQSEDLVTNTYSLAFKVRALNMCLKLIKDAATVVDENVGANYLAEPLLKMIERLPLDVYPAYVQSNYEAARAALQQLAAKKLVKLVPPAKKPKALRLLEPRIETVYDDKRRPKVSKEKEEKLKLLQKVKRETKGAVREIRRDTQFLQKIRIEQQIQSDMERKEKVKRIYAEAAMQQGELNELARLKKKKKF